MKRAVLLGLIVVGLGSGIPADAEAGKNNRNNNVVIYQEDGQTVVVREQRQGMFGRLMEAERRKNAWLRRTFLGR